MKPYKRKKRRKRTFYRWFKLTLNRTVDGFLGFCWKLCFYTMGLFFALVLLFSYVINSETAMTKIITQVVNLQEASVTIEKLNIGKQKYQYPRSIQFDTVHVDLLYQGKQYQLSWKDLNVQSLAALFSRKQDLQFNVNGLKVFSSDVKVDNANLNLFVGVNKKGIENVTGNMNMKGFIVNKLQFSNLKMAILGDSNEIYFDDLVTDFYGGKFEGAFALDYDQKMSYMVKGFVNHVQLNDLRQTNADVFSNVKGEIFGNLRVNGSNQKIDQMSASFSGLEGTQIKASMVKRLFDFFGNVSTHMPKFENYDQANLLLKKDGFIPFEHVNVQLQSSGQKKMFGNVELKSSAYGVNLEVTSDITGGAERLIEQILMGSDAI
jgi:hypothetical protein